MNYYKFKDHELGGDFFINFDIVYLISVEPEDKKDRKIIIFYADHGRNYFEKSYDSKTGQEILKVAEMLAVNGTINRG